MLRTTYYKFALLLIPALFLFTGEIRAQAMRSSDMGRGRMDFGDRGQQPDMGINPFDTPEGEEEGMPADTTKKRRPRKPLESFFFDDSTRSQANFAWYVDMFENKVHMTVIDTLLDNFNLDYFYQKQGVGDAYQGNLGGATVPLAYHDRPDYRNFDFTKPFYSYIFTPETAPFYNVKRPFTRLQYITAGQKRYAEDNFSIIHAQNIAPSTGFNVTYHNMGTRGIYKNQRTRNADLSLGFSHTGKRYSAHAGYIYNKIDVHDNGGVVDDRLVTDSLFEEGNKGIPFWLDEDASGNGGARNVIKNNTVYTVHTYGVPLRRLTDDDFSMSGVPAFYVGYAFRYDVWSKRYNDQKKDRFTGENYWNNFDNPETPNVNEYDPYRPSRGYYPHWYIDGRDDAETRDSISETKLSNRFFLQLQPWDRDAIVGTVNAGAGFDMHSYRMFHPDDYLTGSIGKEKRSDYYIYGSVEGKFRKYFDWGGKLNFVFAGHRVGDLEAEANARFSVYLRGRPVSLSGRLNYSLASPSYWAENLYSNHYKWTNSFAKENKTRFEVKLDAPHWNLEAGLHQSIVGNKIYYTDVYNAEAEAYIRDIKPVQSSGVVSVTGVYARKDFRAGNFHFNHRVLLQWSTDQDVAPVPLFSAYVSYYFEFNVVRNVLRAQIGLDGRYNTKYYALGFNPAVGQFYNQKEKQIGGYPWVDVFAAFKWKRMRIFLKLEHASQDLFGTRDYFAVLHYPLNARVFKYGVSWSFYN